MTYNEANRKYIEPYNLYKELPLIEKVDKIYAFLCEKYSHLQADEILDVIYENEF